MKRIHPFMIGLLSVALAGCLGGEQPAEDITQPDAQNTTGDDVQETRNVIYRGELDEAGATIFMQGTHRLTLNDGRFILLESDVVGLSDYVGQEVEVFGSVRPTTEAGGMIMRVESITSLEASSASSSEGGSSSSTSDSSSSDDAMAAASVSSSSSSSSSSSAASRASSSATIVASGELEAKAEAMARDNMALEHWTQEYCSTHIGFCIPVHRNWWFKSFGTTTSALWHVEIGPSEMNNLGEGPLTVRLVSGDITSSGMSDGQVLVQGDGVVGARAWSGNRHFEIRGPANLEAAVRVLTEQLSESSN